MTMLKVRARHRNTALNLLLPRRRCGRAIVLLSLLAVSVSCARRPDNGDGMAIAPGDGSPWNHEPAFVAPETAAAPLDTKHGIEAVSVRLTSAGYMLDFRYRVVDAERAAPLLDRSTTPVLIDQATGNRLCVPSPPKVGALRQAPRVTSPDRTYFIMFANPGRAITTGSRVTVEVGELRLENLLVE